MDKWNIDLGETEKIYWIWIKMTDIKDRGFLYNGTQDIFACSDFCSNTKIKGVDSEKAGRGLPCHKE